MPSSMMCFKRFFKHTWHPQQMENPSKLEPAKRGVAGLRPDDTELGEVKIIVPSSDIATSTTLEASSAVIPCGSGGCKTSRRHNGESRPESPWHVLKTIFLVSVIIAFVVWVVVYTLLAQYEIL
ncbi:uncharacterized protein [Venturia canescens]|uniref:uncharacterized protein isoform X2 n=1 Tax=Venturia canescens TaxID=32260 RepID=UPI001C9BDC5D|nr:uncharacterized protein LOC122411723 isoform X2 [Venturia canescens]